MVENTKVGLGMDGCRRDLLGLYCYFFFKNGFFKGKRMLRSWEDYCRVRRRGKVRGETHLRKLGTQRGQAG